MPFSKIAILGASGSLGPHILAALLEIFPVSAITILTREGSNSPLIAKPREAPFRIQNPAALQSALAEFAPKLA